ncbi:MAG: cytochrome P450, partial [Candidatus Binatia bacterium]
EDRLHEVNQELKQVAAQLSGNGQPPRVCDRGRLLKRKRTVVVKREETMEYNPFAPEVIENPYPYYAELRAKSPVSWVEVLQGWAVSRYADVDFVLRNPKLFPSSVWMARGFGDMNPVPGVPMLLDMNPPDHTRLRKLANRGFTPRLIRAMETHVRAIARELLAAVKKEHTWNLVDAVSSPLPLIAIAEMLGVEPERRADFKRWSDETIKGTSQPTDKAVRAQILQATAEMRAYLREAIARRRTQPGEDLLTAFVQAEEEGRILSADEVLALVVLLLVAGNETTTNLIGNGVLALLDHPDALAKVRADRTLLPSLVEEILRYDTSVQVVFRETAQEIELGGVRLPAGATLYLLLGSANRDERKFPEPDRFDVRRNPQDHVGFGYGIHLCLGAPLARLESRIVLEELLFACPSFTRAVEHVPHIASLIVRGPQTLPLQFTA